MTTMIALPAITSRVRDSFSGFPLPPLVMLHRLLGPAPERGTSPLHAGDDKGGEQDCHGRARAVQDEQAGRGRPGVLIRGVAAGPAGSLWCPGEAGAGGADAPPPRRPAPDSRA